MYIKKNNLMDKTGKFLMDNVFCSGSEKELADCRFDGWGNSDCNDTEAAGVICLQVEQNATKLVRNDAKRCHVLF